MRIATHSQNYTDKTDAGSIAEDVYKVLTHKKFRSTALPDEKVKARIVAKIFFQVSNNKPVQIFQFWGGCKNVNLHIDRAELTEKATLDNLSRLNKEVREVYEPGLEIFISPGDARVEEVNYIKHGKTLAYVDSLRELAEDEDYQGLFKVVPVSVLYERYSTEFRIKLNEVRRRISGYLSNEDELGKLIVNARKNIEIESFRTKEEIHEKSVLAVKEYIIHRVAEEEANIFRDYRDCIRAFYIKYIPYYRALIIDVEKTSPSLDCSLVFYTGYKGNITQPWQSIGKVGENGKVLFISQERQKSESLE